MRSFLSKFLIIVLVKVICAIAELLNEICGTKPTAAEM